MIFLDFETSYAARTPPGEAPHGLRAQTVPEYLHDPRTKCLGAAVSTADRRQYITPDKLPAVLDQIASLLESGKTKLSAHNATFDLSVWHRFYPLSYHRARRAIESDHLLLVDTEHLARYASSQRYLPPEVGSSIGDLALEYGLEKGDTAEAVESGGQALADYACKDVEIAETELNDLFSRWPESENRLSTIHVLCGTPGDKTLYIDAPLLIDASIETPERAALKKKLRQDAIFESALLKLGVTPEYKTTPAGKRKLALAKGDDFMRALLSHKDARVKRLAEMRQAAGSNIERTRALTMLTASGQGMRPLPLPLRYYAAHTGRSGGTDKMNVQNMPRGGIHRHALIAPPRHKLVVADASQIEVRVLAWLAGDDPTLEIFRNGGDPYKSFAVDLYGLESEADVTAEQRRVAKSAVLGLGFGAGRDGFIIYCKSMGVDISEQEAQRVVTAYRKVKPAVCAYWKQLEREVRDTAAATLPTGRQITYPDMTRDGFTRAKPFNHRRIESNLWGGLIAENVTQATARDITLLDHAVKIAEKWPVVLLVHDEVVCSVPEERADECLADMLEIMSQPPAWCADLPLAAEGSIANNYGEAK